MEKEKIYCEECSINLMVSWEEDEDPDGVLFPEFCPMCGNQSLGEEQDTEEFTDY